MKISYKKDIFSTMMNQSWRIVSGPLTLLCIPLFLTASEQGYWYTFVSLAALSVLADLGFSNIILQFSAHEFAFLHFEEQMLIVGSQDHLQKLAAFFKFSLKWLLKVVIIIFPLIIVGGYFFMNLKAEISSEIWGLSWVLYAVASAFIFINSILLSFLEGCNLVSKIQSLRFKIGIVTSLVMLLGLAVGLKLYALSISASVGAIVGAFFIIKNFKNTIRQLWKISQDATYDWWPEFSSLIWRYAISWGSGFFVFQLFTPLTFYFYGAVPAGKIGISIAMWTAGFNIAISWITAVTPKLNMLISEKKWNQLDKLFNDSLVKSVGTMILGGLGFFLVEYFIGAKFNFFARILASKGMVILFISWLLQVIVNAMSIYLRSHKREPLVLVSFFNAVIVLCGTAFCGMFFEPEYMFLGFLTGTIFQCITTFKIFQNYRWQHANYNGVK